MQKTIRFASLSFKRDIQGKNALPGRRNDDVTRLSPLVPPVPLNLTRLFPQPAGFEATSQLRSYLVEFLFGAAVFVFCHCVSVFVSAACRVRSYLAAQLSRPTGEITAAPPAQAPVSEAPSWELAARAVITLFCSPPALWTVTRSFLFDRDVPEWVQCNFS